MHVPILSEGLAQGRIFGQVRHDAELNLRVIRRQEAMPRGRDKGLAHAPPFLRADGNVLKVGVGGRQAPRGRHRLVIGGVNAPRLRVHLLRQGVRVGALELRQGAVAHDHRRERIVVGQLRQHRLRRGGRALWRLLQHRQLELVVEHFLKLLRGGEVKGTSSQLVGLRFKAG